MPMSLFTDSFWQHDEFFFRGQFRYYRGKIRQVSALIHQAQELYPLYAG